MRMILLNCWCDFRIRVNSKWHHCWSFKFKFKSRSAQNKVRYNKLQSRTFRRLRSNGESIIGAYVFGVSLRRAFKRAVNLLKIARHSRVCRGTKAWTTPFRDYITLRKSIRHSRVKITKSSRIMYIVEKIPLAEFQWLNSLMGEMPQAAFRARHFTHIAATTAPVRPSILNGHCVKTLQDRPINK